MAEIVNLRQFRKQKARQERTEEAASNRAKFGQTKLAKKLNAAEKAQAEKNLDGHKIEE
jgi:hypothetical protein